MTTMSPLCILRDSESRSSRAAVSLAAIVVACKARLASEFRWAPHLNPNAVRLCVIRIVAIDRRDKIHPDKHGH